MNRSLTVLLGLAFLPLQNIAADHIVGPTREFSDLQTAISIAQAGDRILVESGNYPGNIAIEKSLTLLPLQEGGRYSVQGRLYCGGSGITKIQLTGIRVLTSIQFRPDLSARLDLQVTDSYVQTFQESFGQPLLRVEMYRDTIAQGGGLAFGSCAIIGCHIMAASGQLSAAMFLENSALPEENHIIGNVFHELVGTRAIIVSNPNRPYHIENNLAFLTMGDGAFMSLHQGGLEAPMPVCTILNNTAINTGNNGVSALIDGPGQNPAFYYTVMVKNNARIGAGTAAALSTFTSATAPFLVASNNVVAAPSAVNASTGEPQAGSPLIDAGDADARYLDLDLTTNDVGCYGGSNSLANFTTPMGSAVVGFMRAPRIVAQGSPVNISAIGFDR